MQLREVLESGKISILSETKTKDGSVMRIFAPWIEVEKRNRNERIYPRKLLQKEVDRIQKEIAEGSVLGQSMHPKSPNVDLQKASHLITKLWLDKAGTGFLEAKILPTVEGKNVQALIKSGASLGLSARGVGEVGRDKRIQHGYKLYGIDIVSAPSFSEAKFSADNIYESVNFEDPEKEEAKKVQPKDVMDEAVISGISPKKYAEILNRSLEDKMVVNEELSADETKAVLKEATSAGFDISDPKERERIFNNARREKIKSRKPLTEAQMGKLAEEKKKRDKQDSINSLVREKMIATKVFS